VFILSKKEAKLTEKQLAFIDYYLETLNGREAYKRAYGTKNDATADASASRLLSNVKVKEIIDQKLAEIASKRIARVEEVQQFLTSCMRGEIQEEITALQPNAITGAMETVIMSKQLSAKDRIKCAELLGKANRLFIDKVETDITERVVIIDDL
jgi:phage terminase small subunit